MTISLRDGGFCIKKEEHKGIHFSIEDPFDPSNNPGKLVKEHSPGCEKLLNKFVLIMKRIRENKSIFV